MSALDLSPITTFKPDPCCGRQQIATSDHVRGYTGDLQRMVNRFCIRCFTHWYGPECGDIRKFTSKEWDAWLREGGLL